MNMKIGEFARNVKSSVRFWVVLGAHFYVFFHLSSGFCCYVACASNGIDDRFVQVWFFFMLLQWTAYRQSWFGDLRQQSIAWQFCFYSSSWERCHWLAQRPSTDCGCLNFLLPVRTIYNAPVHGLLSAVSDLHLQGALWLWAWWMAEWMVGQAREKPWNAFCWFCTYP